MAKHQTVEEEEEEEAPIHGDILEAILTHVPLIDLVPACHVSTSWKGAVFSSLRHLNPVKPWLIVHAQTTRNPYTTTTHAYDPRSHVWVDIEQPSIKYVSTLRSSHSNLLYMQSPFRFVFSSDPLQLTWHKAVAPLVWRPDPIVALVGERVVIAGGACDFGDDPLAVETYDLKTRAWDTCDDMPAILKDSCASTWLSVAVDKTKMYAMEKCSGATHSLDPITKIWQGPYDLRLGQNVFSSVIGFVNDRMFVVGLVGEAENVESVRMWEVKGEMLDMKIEISEMPKELVVKLKGQSPRVTSIAMNSMGNFVFLHNPSDPAAVIVCEVQNGGSFCSWGSVGNAAVDDGSRIVKNLVYTCANVGLGELHQALRSGDRRFTIKEEME